MLKLKSLFRRGPTTGSKQPISGSAPSSTVNANAISNNTTSTSTAVNNGNDIYNSVTQLSHNNNHHQHNNYPIRSSSSTSSIDGIGKLSSSTTHKTHRHNLEQQQQQHHQQQQSTNLRDDRYMSKESLDGGGSGGSGSSGKISKTERRKLREQQRNYQTAATKASKKIPNDIGGYINSSSDSGSKSTQITKTEQGPITAGQAHQLIINEKIENQFDAVKKDNHMHMKIQELQNHIDRLTLDKMTLETKISELSKYRSEVNVLRNEISKLQINQEMNNTELQKLTNENESLRQRLTVSHSTMPDTEQQQQPQSIEDTNRFHSPNTPIYNNNDTEGNTPSNNPDWDKQSSSSEISVACLQDKIIQMEETHYSTNEELQATLQELADLQSQLSELQADNDRLTEEKDVLFQSLCTQTEKLEDSRTQIGTLQELLLCESKPKSDVLCDPTEREQKLVDLLKNSHDERETVLFKHEELNSELLELRSGLDSVINERNVLKERLIVLESTVDAQNAERKQIDMQLQQCRETTSSRQIEMSRLTTLLENARCKIEEYEQDRALIRDKSETDELLAVARKEKDILEVNIASLQELLSKSECEVEKLKDQISEISEECKVTRNNAKYALADLQYKYDSVQQDKQRLSNDLQTLEDTLNESQIQSKCYFEDKSKLETLLFEAQKHLGDAKRFSNEMEIKFAEEKRLRTQESDEWKQFQADLLMTVRVANDFKTETQLAYEQLVMDNKEQRDKIRQLEQEITKLNKALQDTQSSILNSVVQQEIAVRRQRVAITRQDSRLSVKSLIESIEKSQQGKSNGGGSGGESHYSSTSSLNSLPLDIITPTVVSLQKNGGNDEKQNDLNNHHEQQSEMFSSMTSSHSTFTTKQHQFREYQTVSHLQQQSQQQSQQIGSNLSVNSSNNNNRGILSGDRKDPLNALVKNGGSKRNALLKWCQNKTVGYRNIDITNFSSSWNDGLALCAILHTYLPDCIPYDTLGPNDKKQNFSIAFAAAESVGISTSLNINEMCQLERPDWQQVMAYVTIIYKHFES